MSEDIDEKAVRLVSEGSVTIHKQTRQAVLASVRGDTGNYLVAWDRTGPVCMCPARSGCSHVRAVALVIDQPPRKEPFMTTEYEITETEEVGPETAELATLDPETDSDPELLPLRSTEISFQTLKAIAGTELIPANYRDRPYLILAAVLTGKEYGLGPMASLSHIVMVDGRASISAELATRLIREAGHSIEIVEHSDRVCTLRGVRTDTGDEMTVSFSIEDAARAGLVSIEDGTPRARSRKGHPLPWETYTDDLLWARAISRLHKRLFADLPKPRLSEERGITPSDL